MIFAVIDTNVLVSALLNIDSNPGAVLLSVFDGKTIPGGVQIVWVDDVL